LGVKLIEKTELVEEEVVTVCIVVIKSRDHGKNDTGAERERERERE
jgi:hypothetical protein